MTLINFSTPNLIGGISQQVDQLKLPGQVSDCENFIPHPTDGLVRRNELRLEGITDTTVLPTSYVHWINRDETERYCVVVSDQDLRVFGLDGTEYLVRAPGGGSAASFTYLDIAAAADAPTAFKALTVNDYTFVVNREKVSRVDTSTTTTSPTNGEGYLFFKQSNYNTLYTVVLKFAGGSDKTFRVYIGNGSSTTAQSFHRLTDIGAVGGIWTYTFSGGSTTAYTVVAGDTVDSVHQKLARRIDNLTDCGATADAYGILVSRNDEVGAIGSGIPTLTHSGGVLTSEVYEVQTTVSTEKLAEAFAALIDADADAVASAKGSVVKITKSGAVAEIVKLESVDPLGGVSIATINRQVENVDDLPEYCSNGYIVKVVGNAADIEDDYWIKFVADESSTFGKGTWIESVASGQNYQLDETTFPHQLTRQQNVALNTPVVGLGAGDIYFEFGPMTLNERATGSTNVGTYVGAGGAINDIFFFKNRLGFLTGSYVTLSEAGRYFNFWPTTIRQVLDSDPIGIAVAHTKVAELYSATAFEDQLILWSDRTQFRLQGDPVLTPKTASIQPISEFQNLATVRPMGVGRTLMFATKADGFSRIYEYYSRGDGLRYDATDTTIAVPSLIRGEAKEIAVCPAETSIVVRSTTDSVIYLHRYLYEGDQKIQSAWTKLKFHVGKILGLEVYDSDLYMLVQAGATSAICRMSLKSSSLEEDLLIPHMDFLTTDEQIDPSDIVYDNTTDTTDITVPWVPQTLVEGSLATKTYFMVDRSNAAVGEVIPIIGTSLNTITVRGNVTPGPGMRWYVGSIAPASVTLPTIYLRSDRTSATYQVGNLRLRYGTLSYRNSGYFEVTVAQDGERDDSVAIFSGYSVSNTLTDEVVLGSGKFRFPIHALNDYAEISIGTDVHLHVALVAIEWEAEYNARSTRFGR